jgi:hypothetical protein
MVMHGLTSCINGWNAHTGLGDTWADSIHKWVECAHGANLWSMTDAARNAAFKTVASTAKIGDTNSSPPIEAGTADAIHMASK